jgi:hypothetical protein
MLVDYSRMSDQLAADEARGEELEAIKQHVLSDHHFGRPHGKSKLANRWFLAENVG